MIAQKKTALVTLKFSSRFFFTSNFDRLGSYPRGGELNEIIYPCQRKRKVYRRIILPLLTQHCHFATMNLTRPVGTEVKQVLVCIQNIFKQYFDLKKVILLISNIISL